ncbi:MAG: hypothetical protein K7J15_05600, partial [Candidatus Regiella insecticola]|nr:hypothetical protein [Candidatus Regiella insecticola]
AFCATCSGRVITQTFNSELQVTFFTSHGLFTLSLSRLSLSLSLSLSLCRQVSEDYGSLGIFKRNWQHLN